MNNSGSMEITTRVGCRNKCLYCPQDKFVKNYLRRSDVIEMTIETFKTCLDKIPNNIHIHFSGMAEPWLNDNCTEMVLYTYEKGFDIAVYTTAVGMSHEDVDRIKNLPFRSFVIHLPDDKGYTEIRINENYLQLIKKLTSSEISGVEYMCIGNIHPEIAKILKAHPIRKDTLIDRAGNIHGILGINSQKKLKGKIRCKSCSKLLNHNVLLPNGDVILCCMDYGLQHVLGNLISSSYESLFDDIKHEKLMKGLEDDKVDIHCRYCSNAKQSFWAKLLA